MNSQTRLIWPYPRYSSFSKIVHKAASEWLLVRGYETNPKYPYILASWMDWPKNIILPEVSQFVRERSEKQRARFVETRSVEIPLAGNERPRL